ncbi:SMP-30/gluconolactonase/LRE family protein [Microbacterium ureisolvens]|uniref:SMP-30/gluconolactonase/LRE family protein n=1 Tax=Microbacterium ureisolvens TaxID=2781186 RepID=A0ABS7HYA0_9MICO|nr:SMP-30/gluconolactonase/LRE family protein [Microbacterium ureisolvens]MBW9110364.1 SMP-30/gluconolactonase/LRE family protein [Microbacterium ureisolvens]
MLSALLVGCVDTPDQPAPESLSVGGVQVAEELVQVTSPHEVTGGTLLEGPTFSADGTLHVVDVMAPAGEPKVLRIDVEDKTVQPLYTDDVSAFTSAQVSPLDGRIYLTDFLGSRIVSITQDGEDTRTHFAGQVDGRPVLADDIAFDPEGNMFVTDTTGMDGPGWVTPGRVIRIGVDGAVSVLAEDLPSPNGIVFDENDVGLWVAQYNANRIDYYQLDASRTSVLSAFPAIHVDAGASRIDSTAVDAAGNVYQAFHMKPEIAVYSRTGALVETIRIPGEGLHTATNVAILPGTTRGFITVSGAAGGFDYTFEAAARGIRQSNGG